MCWHAAGFEAGYTLTGILVRLENHTQGLSMDICCEYAVVFSNLSTSYCM